MPRVARTNWGGVEVAIPRNITPADQVYDNLASALIDGQLVPGQRITIRCLAEML